MAVRVSHTLHFFSVDIALGVAGSMALIGTAAESSLPWQWYPLVACGTWLVYILDRILDIRRARGCYPTKRHEFIKEHLSAATALAIVLIITCSLLIFHVSLADVWPAALVAASSVVSHHILQRCGSWRWTGVIKDVHVAVAYTAGTAVVPLSYGQLSLQAFAAIAVVFFCTAAIVAVESAADVSVDEHLDQPALARVIGAGACVRLAYGCAALACCAATLLPWIATLQSLSTMALPLLFTSRLSLPNKRLMAELVLAMPLTLLSR
jgi:4-hydroxybenzoate polyprenyltransferase